MDEREIEEAKCVSKIRLGDYFTRASGVEAEGRMREASSDPAVL